MFRFAVLRQLAFFYLLVGEQAQRRRLHHRSMVPWKFGPTRCDASAQPPAQLAVLANRWERQVSLARDHWRASRRQLRDCYGRPTL